MKKLLCFVLCLLFAASLCVALADESGTSEDTDCKHSYDAGVETTSPTCGQAGVKTCTCTLCGATKTEGIPATGKHSWDDGSITTAATCQAEGVKTFTCTVCKGTKTEPVAKNPGNHSYGPWDGGQADIHTRTCPCGHSQSASHSFDVTATVPATCKEEGATAYGCSACKRIEYEIIPKLTTHTYDNDCDPDCNVCGATREAAHKYSTVWSRDGLTHWHACAKCDDKGNLGKHFPGPAATEEKAQLCLTCGYVLTSRLKHTHSYETTLTSDETGHWYACTGCEEQQDFEAHTFDSPCDPDCNVCGYVTDSAHTADTLWSSDESGHWHICVDCGEHMLFAAHRQGENGLCSVCGYTLALATEETHAHAGEGDWFTDGDAHWKLCACGEVTGKEAHSWQKDGKNLSCSVCGAEKEAEVKNGSGSGLALILTLLAAVAVVAVGLIIWLILHMKKKPGKYAR